MPYTYSRFTRREVMSEHSSWTVQDHSERLWGPYTPSQLHRYVVEGRIHPDWAASNGSLTCAVGQVIWQAIQAAGAQPPGEQASNGPAWTVRDTNGRDWGPYGPAWLLWYLATGQLRPDWQASDGLQTCTVSEALSRRAGWRAQAAPEDVRCPNCGALVPGSRARCPYCGTDVRGLRMTPPSEPLTAPQFVYLPCLHCEGTLVVPIDPATRTASCLDCRHAYNCLIGKVRSVGGYVIWEKNYDSHGGSSAAPTSKKRWQIRYDEINTGNQEELLDFTGSIDIAVGAGDIFVCLLEPGARRISSFTNVNLDRSWRISPGCLTGILTACMLVALIVLC